MSPLLHKATTTNVGFSELASTPIAILVTFLTLAILAVVTRRKVETRLVMITQRTLCPNIKTVGDGLRVLFKENLEN